jgi:parvulin-like peptidyl-prolyl isomerase
LLFLLAGIVLFILYSRFSTFFRPDEKEIIISAAQVELIRASFEKTWNRPPTDSELEAQVNNYVMDEVFFKEAVAMGLDKKDPAVKRRLRQIIEMMLDDYATVYPTESQLQQYLAEHAEDFRLPSRISFSHLYFRDDEKAVAEAELAKLRAGKSPDQIKGKRLLMIAPEFQNETDYEIERQFGKEFTRQLFKLTPGQWNGPVSSAYGWHLVLVKELIDGEIPALDQVRTEVEREWVVQERNKLKEKQYEKMRSQYDISIQYPGSAD